MSYCLKWRKNGDSKNLKVVKTKTGTIMDSANCTVCSSKRSRFIKEQEASGILSSLWIKLLIFSKSHLSVNILF